MRVDAEDQSVTHEISVVENDYILVEVSGTVTREERVNIHSQIIETIKDTGVARALIDHSKSRLSMTTLENYKFGKILHETLSTVGLPHRPRLAIVVPSEAPNREDKEFAATVASNLGVNIRVFTDRQQGIAYLLANNQ